MTRPPAGHDGTLLRRWTHVPGHARSGDDRSPDASVPPADRIVHSRETRTGQYRAHDPVVLLHGVGTTSRYFRPLLRELGRRGRAARAPELPGIGATPAVDAPRHVGTMGHVTASWLRTRGPEPVTLVGNSLGAQVALEVAVRHPELVRRVVLIGPTVDARHRGLLRQAGRLLVDATRERPATVATAVSDGVFTSRRVVWRYLAASLRHRPELRVPRLTVPLVVVRGTRDPLAPAAWARRLASLAPEGHLVELPGLAHAPHHGDPETMADVLTTLDDLDGHPTVPG